MQYQGQILQSMNGQYEKLEKIGEGAYGCVFKAYNCLTQETVAIKKIKIDLENDGTPQTAIREISIMQSFNHPNIVPIKDFFYQQENQRVSALYIVFEYANFDLHRYIKKSQQISSITIKHFMYQILLALQHCHESGVIHRDLKPQNILIQPQKQDLVQLCDFGLARTINLPIKTLTHEVETLWYRAPEILLGTKSYSLGVDI